MDLTVGLPTYNREEVLVQTIQRVLEIMDPARMELVVVDQTPEHQPEVARRLDEWRARRALRWIKLQPPSLTSARNTIVQAARGRVVLFLDDDVRIPAHLLTEHEKEFQDASVAAVTGQVYNCLDYRHPPDLDHPERGTRPHSELREPGPARNISGGNHSVRVAAARAVGGYDTHFVGAALAEDLDFSQRLLRAGYQIRYNPKAWIIHLGLPSGGCAVQKSRLWPEWSHSASLALYAFRHGRRQGNFWSMMWMAVRHGPGRKEVVLRPWLWPAAWWGWARGVGYGFRHRHVPPGMRSGEKS